MQEYHCCAVQIKKQNKNNRNVIVLFKTQSYEKKVQTVMGNNSIGGVPIIDYDRKSVDYLNFNDN